MSTSTTLPVCLLLYIASYIPQCSALPRITTQLSDYSTVLRNQTTCHGKTTTDTAAASGASNNNNDFLSTTTFGVLSVVLALGSLIVGIIGVMQYRQRRRCQLMADKLLLQQPTSVPMAPAMSPQNIMQQEPSSIIEASTSTSSVLPCKELQTTTTSSSSASTLVNSAMSTEEETKTEAQTSSTTSRQSQNPTRPALLHLRLRSSRLQSQALRLSYRTSTI